MAVSTGCYLLAVIGEPVSEDHKQIILQRLNKGLLSWDIGATGCDLQGIESVCASVTDKTALENDLLIQYSTESLGVEVLVNPTMSTLKQCVKNLLISTIGHKHIIHAGYTFTGSGSWIMQNGAYSFEDFLSSFKDAQVQGQKGSTIHVHCIEEGDWNSLNFEQDVFAKVARVLLNPVDKLDQLPGANYLVDCLQSVLSTQSLTEIMEASPLVGNIRFNRPTLYLFPAGQGDCALFGINGFNMLVDGGFNRKPCSWEFIRHLDRLDAVLVTRLSESNLCSMSTLMKRKTLNNTYPQIGYVFCNIAEGKNPSPTEERQKDKNELLVSVVGEGHQFIDTLNDLKLVPHQCWCDSSTEPFVLYHKVGHGTLEMYVLSPPKDSKEMKDFLSEWSSYKENFSCVKTELKGKGQGALIPLSHATSVCAILIWRPNDPKDTITRILFPGSAPQNKIFEGLEKLKNLDILKQPTVTKASLSTILISKAKKTNGPISKASIPNRKHTASPALSISSMASRNGDVAGMKKDLKTDNKSQKEIKRVPKDVKKDIKVIKELKKESKETKELKKDNKETKELKKETKEVKKEVKDTKISEKKTTTKSSVKKTTPISKSATDSKKPTVKKDTPSTKKEISTKTTGVTKLESKSKSPPTKTSETKTAKEILNKKAAETKTASKPKSKPTAAAQKASPAASKSKAAPVPKSPSKLSRAIAASAAVATAAVAVGVAAELIEPQNEEVIEREELKKEIDELKPEIGEEPKVEIGEEPMVEIGKEQTVEIGEEPKAEIGEEPKAEIGEEPKAEIGEEPKAEIGEEPKAEIGEEPKAEIGEEPKAKIGEEPKVEINEPKVGITEETKVEIEEELKVEMNENVEIEENVVAKELTNVLQNALAHEDDEINIEHEIPISPLRQEAVSPALSEPVSLTASDTLSSAPMETVSPTPPPHDVASPTEEKEDNEIKELDLGTPVIEEKIIDQEMGEIPPIYQHEDIQKVSEDEIEAEDEEVAVVKDENLEKISEVNKDLGELRTPEPVEEEILVKRETNTDLMSASFVAESLEQAEEEYLTRQSAVQEEVEKCVSDKSKTKSEEMETTYEEKVTGQEFEEYQIGVSEDTTDIDAQLASATMEGSFCAGVTNTVNNNDYNMEKEINEKEYFSEDCTTNIMETSIVLTETSVQADTDYVESYEIKDSENYEMLSENAGAENLDIPDYHQELNPSLEVNIHESHSEISTQGSDIKSEEIQQISNSDENQMQDKANVEGDIRLESAAENNPSDEEIHMEGHSTIEIKQEQMLSGMEIHMEQSYQSKKEDDSDKETELENISSNDEVVESNLSDLGNFADNLDIEPNFSDVQPKEMHSSEKEECSKESFIEKDIDESIAEIEHAPKLVDHSAAESQINNNDKLTHDASEVLPVDESILDENSQQYNFPSSDHELPQTYDIPENLSLNEKSDDEAKLHKPDEYERNESPNSMVHEQDNKEDVEQSEDDVDIQHYMSKECTDDMNRGISPTVPYKESDSDHDEIVKSPMPQDDVTDQIEKAEISKEVNDSYEYEKSNEEKQSFDEKDHDSAEEEMIRHPSPPGSREFYEQVGPNASINEMKDPITQHFISSPIISKKEEPLYEEPEDSGSESPIVEQPVFGNIEKVDYPELVTVSGGTTPSEPQSPKSPLDSKKGLGALEIEVMEALSEHECSESSSQSPLVCDEQTAFDLSEKVVQRADQTIEVQSHCTDQSVENSSNILEESEMKLEKEHDYHHNELSSEITSTQENNVESHKQLDLGYDAQDVSESDYAYQPESDFHYEQTSELVCKPESEQHCASRPDSQLESDIHEDERIETLDGDIVKQNNFTERDNEQKATHVYDEIAAEGNVDIEKAYGTECGFLPPSDFANEDQASNLQPTEDTESIPAQIDLSKKHEEISHDQDISSLEKCSSDTSETHFSNVVGEPYCQNNEQGSVPEKEDPSLLHESFHGEKECDHDAPESHQNAEYCDQSDLGKETQYFEETTDGASKHIVECDSSHKAIPESERHYRNGFSTTTETSYSAYTSDMQLPPHGINGQNTNSWEMYSHEYSEMESSYNSNYNSTYSEMNTAKIISGEQQIPYVTDTYYQSDSPEDNSMKNSSTPDVPSPVDPKIEDPLNPLSLEPPIGYDGINNKFAPISDDYHPDNMNYMIPPPLKKNGTNVDRPYGESSDEEDSSSLPGNVSPYAYTNKAYNQEEEEDADGNHIIKPPLGMDQSTEDGNPISTFDSNNPQNFPENLTFESHHQRVSSGLVYSPGFNQDLNTADPPAYDFRLEEWGKPMGLPTPPDATTKAAKKPTKTTTSKSAVKAADKRSSLENSNGKMPTAATKLMSSPLKKVKEAAGGNDNPVYVDLAYVPHHGDPHYSDVEFFKRIRARYYVFSGINPSKEVLNALLEAKKGWNEDLETTIIPTYETDTLGYWMAQNQEALTEYSIDVAPSASRCTVNLQDHETSCAAYRLEF